MRMHRLAIMICVVLAGPAFADLIDDAEAKRRGVPPVVIQLEKQLATEKNRTAGLEKQIAEVEKKIAEVNGNKAAAPKAAPARVDPLLPKLSDGVRKASPLYDDFMARYMAGDWAKLNTDIAAKGTALTNLGPGNASDINYVRAALLQCRPAWLEKTKSGSSQSFEANVFGRKFPVTWNAANYNTGAASRDGRLVVTVLLLLPIG